MHRMLENRSVVVSGSMIVMRYDKIFGGNGNVQYIGCNGSLMGIYACHISPDCLFMKN